MIELKNVTKVYKSKKGKSTTALDNINLKFDIKGMTFILGKSGSGKSTLLNILGALDKQTSGELLINGNSTNAWNEVKWDSYRNTCIGFIFQDFNLLENYSVKDNIKLALNLQNKKINDDSIKNVLEQVELSGYENRLPNELSGGERERIAIARAIIKKPDIILADEPTGNIDSKTSEAIFKILKKLSKDCLVVVVTHDESFASKYADRIVRISDGKILEDTKEVTELKTNQLNLKTFHLPNKFAVKMGLENLFLKKFKLFLSVIMLTGALICCCIFFSIYKNDTTSDYMKKIDENGATNIIIRKYSDIVDFTNPAGNLPEKMPISTTELSEIEANTNLTWHYVYEININNNDLSWEYFKQVDNTLDKIYYTRGQSNYFTEYSEDFDSVLIGNKPLNNDEVVITSYTADLMIYYGIIAKSSADSTNSIKFKPNNYEDIINSNYYYNLGNFKYLKIVGIIDKSKELKEFLPLKEYNLYQMYDLNYNSEEYKKIYKLESKLSIANLQDNLNYIYTSKEFINSLNLTENNISNSGLEYTSNNKIYTATGYGYLNDTNDLIGSNINNDNEIIINTALLNEITLNDYNNQLSENNINSVTEEKAFLEKYLQENNILQSKIKNGLSHDKIYLSYDNFKDYSMVGVVIDNDTPKIYFSKELVKDLIKNPVEYQYIYTRITNSKELNTILKYYPINNSKILSYSIYSVQLVNQMMTVKVFSVVGKIGFIFFSILAIIILMNFLENSISYRNKEIGILRALGCQLTDTVKIFVYELLDLAIISSILTFIISPLLIDLINGIFESEALLTNQVLCFSAKTVLFISMFGIIISFVSGLIPLIKFSKKKPITIIRDNN